ncbi:TrmH family RNA methyltransferase, partial [Gemmatimonadota bacterium]
ILASVAWSPVRGERPEIICEKLEERKARRLLCLDAVSDPGNVGSLLRAADAFGMDGVLLGMGTVESTNPKVVRSAVGSLFSLPIVVEEVSLAPVLQQLQEEGWQVLRAEVRVGVSLSSVKPKAKWALLLGSEAHGVSGELGGMGEAVHIGMRGAAESLNVAMAGGILLHGLTNERKPGI